MSLTNTHGNRQGIARYAFDGIRNRMGGSAEASDPGEKVEPAKRRTGRAADDGILI